MPFTTLIDAVGLSRVGSAFGMPESQTHVVVFMFVAVSVFFIHEGVTANAQLRVRAKTPKAKDYTSVPQFIAYLPAVLVAQAAVSSSIAALAVSPLVLFAGKNGLELALWPAVVIAGVLFLYGVPGVLARLWKTV